MIGPLKRFIEAHPVTVAIPFHVAFDKLRRTLVLVQPEVDNRRSYPQIYSIPLIIIPIDSKSPDFLRRNAVI